MNCSYWGWGGEDTDLYRRVRWHNMTVAYHEPKSQANYKTLQHQDAEPNAGRFKILKTTLQRLETDGLVDLQYKRLDLHFNPLCTRIVVDIVDQASRISQ